MTAPPYLRIWTDSLVTAGPWRMPLLYKVSGGPAPAGGRSLYISLHGGGNVAPAVNHQQWLNQTCPLRPARGGVRGPPRAG